MKFDEMIKSHNQWKMKISEYIRHPDKSLMPDNCLERGCDIYEWAQSNDADLYRNLPEFNELMKVHKAFHHSLGQLVFNANRGVEISEEMAIGLDSPFYKQYESLIKLLNRLKNYQEKMAA